LLQDIGASRALVGTTELGADQQGCTEGQRYQSAAPPGPPTVRRSFFQLSHLACGMAIPNQCHAVSPEGYCARVRRCLVPGQIDIIASRDQSITYAVGSRPSRQPTRSIADCPSATAPASGGGYCDFALAAAVLGGTRPFSRT